MKTRGTWVALSAGISGMLLVALTALGQPDQEKAYGQQDREKDVKKAVKLTIENKSGKKVLIVLHRYKGPDSYYAAYLDPDAGVKDVLIAAEWRPVVVYEQDAPHVIQPGWTKGYHFDKDSQITIKDKDLEFK